MAISSGRLGAGREASDREVVDDVGVGSAAAVASPPGFPLGSTIAAGSGARGATPVGSLAAGREVTTCEAPTAGPAAIGTPGIGDTATAGRLTSGSRGVPAGYTVATGFASAEPAVSGGAGIAAR